MSQPAEQQSRSKIPAGMIVAGAVLVLAMLVGWNLFEDLIGIFLILIGFCSAGRQPWPGSLCWRFVGDEASRPNSPHSREEPPCVGF